MRLDTMSGVSPLGAWSYTSWRPTRLAGFVDHLWAYRGVSLHRRKRIFPTGCIELIVNFAEPYRVLEGHGNEFLRVASVGGPQAGPMVVEQPVRQDCIGVHLRPAGAYAVLAQPLRHLTGLSVDLADVIGGVDGEIVERCEAADSVGERFRLVADWLTARIARTHSVDESVAWAVGTLDASGGTASIAGLRERTGLSKERLAAAFREQVGLTPKLYGRVVRFRRTLHLLQAGRTPHLVDAALEGSFYDQPHMNAEFRALGGITPREFLAARHPVGDGSTAADVAPMG